jgi:hypothetical protein
MAALYPINCDLFSTSCVYEKLNTSIKIRYKKFLHETATDWITEKENEGSTSTKCQLTNHQPTLKGPKKICPQGGQETSACINWKNSCWKQRQKEISNQEKQSVCPKQHKEQNMVHLQVLFRSSCAEKHHARNMWQCSATHV